MTTTTNKPTKPTPNSHLTNCWKTSTIKKANISGVAQDFLIASVPGWTSPAKLVNSIPASQLTNTTASRALEHIRTSFSNIGKSTVSEQLSRYVRACHAYSQKPSFQDSFFNLYNNKQGHEIEKVVSRKSRGLSLKALNNAFEITDKAVDIIRVATMRDLKDEAEGAHQQDRPVDVEEK